MKIDPIDLTSTALLFDIDGTLLDIAPRPHEVHVPKSLCETLHRLRQLTGGALAMVSGRPIKDIDALFAPLHLSAVGGHGAEVRAWSVDDMREWTTTHFDDHLRRRLRALAGDGVLVEDKGYSVAVHYRLAPEREPLIRAAVEAVKSLVPDGAAEILGGKAMIELKKTGFDKGTGVRSLMAHPPFAGRRPIFIGDDITDEFAVAVVPEFSGKAFSVGRDMPGATRMFDTPADVRIWLNRLAEGEVSVSAASA
ncbi:MAG: otsB [Xanthobacteraceae bacterium]|nr:otsB [Xanthobacteraceae bacterium]